MDQQLSRRQQQPRSNSIGGQEFGLGGHQRLKQSHYNYQTGLYVDSNQQYYNQRLRYNANQLQQQQQQQNGGTDRLLSPMHFGRTTDFNMPQRGGSIKYPPDRHPRNHLHASLECLNIAYSDYNQEQKQAQQTFSRYQLGHQQHQQQQHQYQQLQQIHNPHYAASYVMAPAPAETVINRDAEQDLAAAAMGTPPTQQQNQQPQQQFNHIPIASSSNVMVTQHSLINSRNNVPAPQSPLHRRISAHGPNSSILSHLTGNSSNPMRAGHSSLSLASSTYLIEDKLQHEIKKLEGELKSEKEKNDALNSQLNINSNLMAAFEQSLTTLNTRVRQLSALNERKDKEIEELREKLDNSLVSNRSATSDNNTNLLNPNDCNTSSCVSPTSEMDKESEQNLRKTIEDLRRQLIEKDRLLTDTRLEALSAAHQLEQMESRLNGEHSILVHDDDLDEGVMVVNHSPSDSEAMTDSTHFTEMNSQSARAGRQKNQQDQIHLTSNTDDMMLFTQTHNSTSESNNTSSLSNNSNHSHHSVEDSNHNHQQNLYQHQYQQHQDTQSNHSSSDYHVDDKSAGDISSQHELTDERIEVERCTRDEVNNEVMSRMLDNMLVSN